MERWLLIPSGCFGSRWVRRNRSLARESYKYRAGLVCWLAGWRRWWGLRVQMRCQVRNKIKSKFYRREERYLRMFANERREPHRIVEEKRRYE